MMKAALKVLFGSALLFSTQLHAEWKKERIASIPWKDLSSQSAVLGYAPGKDSAYILMDSLYQIDFKDGVARKVEGHINDERLDLLFFDPKANTALVIDFKRKLLAELEGDRYQETTNLDGKVTSEQLARGLFAYAGKLRVKDGTSSLVEFASFDDMSGTEFQIARIKFSYDKKTTQCYIKYSLKDCSGKSASPINGYSATFVGLDSNGSQIFEISSPNQKDYLAAAIFDAQTCKLDIIELDVPKFERLATEKTIVPYLNGTLLQCLPTDKSLDFILWKK